MEQLAIFAICVLAIAIGWFSGRYPVSNIFRRVRYRRWRKSYMEGLGFLLNEQSDQAVEQFIQSWEVNSENFDLHNALANMLRRKGEVDRAIPIHSNLLTKTLPQHQIRLATTELAQDYVSAGLLDRAERLLINVVNSSDGFEEKALELLQQVYQLEKEWDKAITIAEQLIPKRRLAFEHKTLSSGGHHSVIAQYYCEKAKLALKEDNFKQAEAAIDHALNVDENCSRALLLRARLACESGQKNELAAPLEQLLKTEPSLLIEALPLVQQCYENEPETMLSSVTQWIEYYPSAELEKLAYSMIQKQDEQQAKEFLTQQLKRRPTLRGIDLLLSHEQQLHKNESAYLSMIHQLIRDLLKNKTSYLCKQCGFSGNQLHWLCPKCQSWDSIRRIRGAEGD